MNRFFEQGKSTVDNYQSFVDNLGQQLKDIKQAQHQERQKLQELQTALKNSMSGYMFKEVREVTLLSWIRGIRKFYSVLYLQKGGNQDR